jgi:hypothetical protein
VKNNVVYSNLFVAVISQTDVTVSPIKDSRFKVASGVASWKKEQKLQRAVAMSCGRSNKYNLSTMGPMCTLPISQYQGDFQKIVEHLSKTKDVHGTILTWGNCCLSQ